MPKQNNKALFVILLTIFIDLVGIGILIPVIPQLLTNPHSPAYMLPTGMTVQYGYILLGALVGAYPLAQFFAAPILGQLSDRFGRRPVLMWCLFGTAVGYAVFAIGIMTHNLIILFAGRILDGLTGGNLPVAQAAIADSSTPENRSKNFGLMGAAFGLGFIVGPYIGGQLADAHVVSWFNATTPFLFAAILSFMNMLSIGFFFSETFKGRSVEPLHPLQSVRHIIRAFGDTRLRWIFLSGFFFQSGFSFFTTLFGVFLISRYGFTESNTGNFFAYVGIWIVFTQAVITPFFSRMLSERKILNFAFICTGLALLLFLSPGPWTVMLFTTPFFSIFNGLVQANFLAFLSRSASKDIQGGVLGINASVAALSQAIPPMLSGLIAAQWAPSASILVASGIMIFAGILFLLTVRHDPSTPAGEMAMAH